jgi:hypothetical protein
VEALRALRRKEPPDPRITAVLRNRILFKDGVPIAAVESGQIQLLTAIDPAATQLFRYCRLTTADRRLGLQDPVGIRGQAPGDCVDNPILQAMSQIEMGVEKILF